VSELPTTSLGKVDTRALKEMATKARHDSACHDNKGVNA
jgi:hypothetical protein